MPLTNRLFQLIEYFCKCQHFLSMSDNNRCIGPVRPHGLHGLRGMNHMRPKEAQNGKDLPEKNQNISRTGEIQLALGISHGPTKVKRTNQLLFDWVPTLCL